jgi:large subunit ribosomal protein L18
VVKNLADKATYVVKFRRRRVGRTDYKKRRTMLISGKTRFVVRKSNKGLACQVIDSKDGQDRVVCQANSNELKSLGWKFSGSNTPAAYLTGLLCSVRSNKKSAVADMGIYISTKGSRLYAALGGAVDGGMKIPYDEKMLPSQDRIRGKHIRGEIEKNWGEVKSKVEKMAKK